MHDAGTLQHTLISSLEVEHVRAHPEACRCPIYAARVYHLLSRSGANIPAVRRLRQEPVSEPKSASGIARSVLSATQRLEEQLCYE